MDALISKQTVVFKELNESVYIRAIAWGISGNHNEVIISSEPIKPEGRPSEEKDYIFYTTEIYYKKQGIDTLFVYADGSSIGKEPTIFTKKIKIVPIKISTADEAVDYEKNYKEYGLIKITAYPQKWKKYYVQSNHQAVNLGGFFLLIKLNKFFSFGS